MRRRLRPLYLASFLQMVTLWVPIEKLFMNEIGFDPASIGIMAAAYAAVVPFLEIPSGILADRWSRRGVLIIANIALGASVLVGGLSQNVGSYFAAAILLGVFFAMQSGTLDSVVYDTLIEETGGSDGFDKALGRLRFYESVALVTSSLAGAWLAGATSLRLTYFLTIPFIGASMIALFRFREPHLHESDEDVPLRTQVATTYRTLLERGSLRSVIVTMVLAAVLMQALLEFGPLWMVALAAPTAVYGPHWAGLTSALGLGGLVAAHVPLQRRAVLGVMIVAMVACSAALTFSRATAVVIVAQAGLVLSTAVASVFLTQRLHDALPSSIRAGVASGVGSLTWIMFLPLAVAFGVLSDRVGVYDAGWLLFGVTVAFAVALARSALRAPSPAPAPPPPVAPRPVAAERLVDR